MTIGDVIKCPEISFHTISIDLIHNEFIEYIYCFEIPTLMVLV